MKKTIVLATWMLGMLFVSSSLMGCIYIQNYSVDTPVHNQKQNRESSSQVSVSRSEPNLDETTSNTEITAMSGTEKKPLKDLWESVKNADGWIKKNLW